MQESRVRWMVAIVLALLPMGAGADDERAIGLLRDWIRSVGQHEPGEADEGLSRIAVWTYGDLERMRGYVDVRVTRGGARVKARPGYQ